MRVSWHVVTKLLITCQNLFKKDFIQLMNDKNIDSQSESILL